ncbi:MAG: response regulator [Hyphomicrobiaceae bacterium]
MSKTILMIEDTEDNRQILRDLFSSTGYFLIEAGDGATGIAMAQAHNPDLILMDIQLPVLDGYETTRRLKADPIGEGARRRLRRLRHQTLQPATAVGAGSRRPVGAS